MSRRLAGLLAALALGPAPARAGGPPPEPCPTRGPESGWAAPVRAELARRFSRRVADAASVECGCERLLNPTGCPIKLLEVAVRLDDEAQRLHLRFTTGGVGRGGELRLGRPAGQAQAAELARQARARYDQVVRGGGWAECQVVTLGGSSLLGPVVRAEETWWRAVCSDRPLPTPRDGLDRAQDLPGQAHVDLDTGWAGRDDPQVLSYLLQAHQLADTAPGWAAARADPQVAAYLQAHPHAWVRLRRRPGPRLLLTQRPGDAEGLTVLFPAGSDLDRVTRVLPGASDREPE